jgi:hypothetical protein
MKDDLAAKLHIAMRGGTTPKIGVAGVTGVAGVSATCSKSLELQELRQLRIKTDKLENDETRGVAWHVASPPVPSMDSPPLGISRTLTTALDMASRNHIQFWLDEQGVLVTQPPRDYKREVQLAERSLMDRREEIKKICQLPERPKGYSDVHWVRAVANSARLGYRAWREG